jgi:hypothetical protein
MVLLRPDDPRGRLTLQALGFLLRDTAPEGGAWLAWELASQARLVSLWVPEAGSLRWQLARVDSDRSISPEALEQELEPGYRACELIEPPELSEVRPVAPEAGFGEAVKAILSEVDRLDSQPRLALTQLQGALAQQPESATLYHRAIGLCLREGEAETLRKAAEYYALSRLMR